MNGLTEPCSLHQISTLLSYPNNFRGGSTIKKKSPRHPDILYLNTPEFKFILMEHLEEEVRHRPVLRGRTGRCDWGGFCCFRPWAKGWFAQPALLPWTLIPACGLPTMNNARLARLSQLPVENTPCEVLSATKTIKKEILSESLIHHHCPSPEAAF